MADEVLEPDYIEAHELDEPRAVSSGVSSPEVIAPDTTASNLATPYVSLPSPPSWFDEESYLASNPDIAAAVADGTFKTGYAHFLLVGWSERRIIYQPGDEPRDRLISLAPAGTAPRPALSGQASGVPCVVEQVLLSAGGGIFVTGWLRDEANPVRFLRLASATWIYTFPAASLARARRRDVEAATKSDGAHAHGFFAFAFTETDVTPAGPAHVIFGFADGSQTELAAPRRVVDEARLRDVTMEVLALADFSASGRLAPFSLLELPFGQSVIAQNRAISQQIRTAARAEVFGSPAQPPRGSIVVCLYGRPEFLFLQHALFAGRPGFADYEFIYVSNSPECAERLMEEARIAQLIYGVKLTLVLLPGNAGFGAANNAAVRFANSNRLIIMNPDVVPRDLDWALKHTALVEGLPEEQTRLFGVPLFYDDGSLMHGGMYFEFDSEFSVCDGEVIRHHLARVEHYGKGAPADAARYLKPRPVPAVTGAFMSVSRSWFETLGGFSEDFVFGHYEDADFCLKSICAGSAPWLHDIRLYHLEGKGSNRLSMHEGGALVNRWLFARRWREIIVNGLEGPMPNHPLLLAPEDA